MKTLRYIVLFLLCVPAMFTKAQELTNAQERFMRMDVLYLMEDYSLYSNLVLDDDRLEFLNLFADTSVQIYNDLLGISAAATLPVSEYAEKLLEVGGGSSSISIMNISHEDSYYLNGLWYMDVTFNKRLYYMIDCDLQFSSEEYYNADHILTAQISWNPENRQCKIEQLRGRIESEVEPLPEHFWVFKLNDNNDTLLLYDNKPIRFDRFGQAFIPKEEFNEEIHKKKETPLTVAVKHFRYPSDSDMQLRLNYEDEACNLLNMSYIPKRWRFKVYANLVPKNYYKIESTYSKMATTSSATEVGAEFGYVFPSPKKNSKWAFYFGASYRMSELNASIDQMSYIYRTKQDIDGDEYYRAYFIDDMEYIRTSGEVGIPLYFNWEGKFNSRFSFMLDFGAKAYLAVLGPQTSFSARYTTKGLYTKYSNLVLHSGSFGGNGTTINGFVTNANISTSGIEPAKNYEGLDGILNSLRPSVDAMAGVGLRIRVLSNAFLDLGCRYQYNVYSHTKPSGKIQAKDIPYDTKLQNFKFTNGNLSNESNVPISFTRSGGVQRENISNLTDYFSKMDNSSLYFNAGVVIRY